MEYEFQSNSFSNNSKVDNSNKAALQTESKPNTVVEPGEVKNKSRRVYFVANNYRFKKKFDFK